MEAAMEGFQAGFSTAKPVLSVIICAYSTASALAEVFRAFARGCCPHRGATFAQRRAAPCGFDPTVGPRFGDEHSGMAVARAAGFGLLAVAAAPTECSSVTGPLFACVAVLVFMYRLSTRSWRDRIMTAMKASSVRTVSRLSTSASGSHTRYLRQYRAKITQQCRDIARSTMERLGLAVPDATFVHVAETAFESKDGATVPMRVFRPQHTPGPVGGKRGNRWPCVLYLHGGGYVLLGSGSHDDVCCQLAHRANVVVVAVDYRLAPEHKHPIPLDDCTGAYWHIVHNAKSLHIRPDRIIVAGDSAGGALAAGLCLRLRDHAGWDGASPMKSPQQPIGQALVYPCTDSTLSQPSINEYANTLLSKRMMKWYVNCLMRASDDPTEASLSPLLASSHHKLPPALVVVAQDDLLKDEGIAYAQALLASGSSAQLCALKRAPHGVLSLRLLYPSLQNQVVQELVNFIGLVVSAAERKMLNRRARRLNK